MLINVHSKASLGEVSDQNGKKSYSVPLDRVAVIVLGGGEGKRLSPLTKTRCKPAISFGGRYSLIDVPISHSLSSGLSKIFVIGQYLSYTLQKHLFQTYLHYGMAQNQIQLLVPEEREGERIWYNGTADAVRKNLQYFSEVDADYFLILSGDQLYNINFQELIHFGIEKDASMLVASQLVKKKDAKRMGLMKVGKDGSQVVEFCEKPQDDALLEHFRTDQGEGEKAFLGSMGIYLFKRESLFNLLKEDSREDFGKHLIRTEMKKGSVHTYMYNGYWEDIGTIDSYYHANLALTHPCKDSQTGLQCYDESSQLITRSYHLPGSQITSCHINKALICEGSTIEASEVTQSVIGVRSQIGQGCTIRDSILMGNEYYHRPSYQLGKEGKDPGIGENTLISKAIIDENVTIGKGVKLINQHGYEEFDALDGLVHVRDGIIIVPRGKHIPDHYIF
ncbi:MAG: Glucose-1-phosphate adenylyltransferase [Chlamydiales bacterium]|nr:Glucose-1-phosphate adenylyltransferase [Chlamydiales bacterium]MCH9619725.1 Glucose-1-phosphate adenylyltransferase [Chlamydiales bacterium]MCH9623331.1 Glucose-1-phosphate adenylyltransferase [Chlamydiales bacterium]